MHVEELVYRLPNLLLTHLGTKQRVHAAGKTQLYKQRLLLLNATEAK